MAKPTAAAVDKVPADETPPAHPDVVAAPVAAAPLAPVVEIAHEPIEKLCGNCIGWQRMNQRAAVGQCLTNSKFMSGPFYTADMNTCSLFKVGVI